jgi:hypothetical protein
MEMVSGALRGCGCPAPALQPDPFAADAAEEVMLTNLAVGVIAAAVLVVLSVCGVLNPSPKLSPRKVARDAR